jgi:hypothetical protein
MLHTATYAGENFPRDRAGLVGQLGDVNFFIAVATDQCGLVPERRIGNPASGTRETSITI